MWINVLTEILQPGPASSEPFLKPLQMLVLLHVLSHPHACQTFDLTKHFTPESLIAQALKDKINQNSFPTNRPDR